MKVSESDASAEDADERKEMERGKDESEEENFEGRER